jgi:hypothetical protein
MLQLTNAAQSCHLPVIGSPLRTRLTKLSGSAQVRIAVADKNNSAQDAAFLVQRTFFIPVEASRDPAANEAAAAPHNQEHVSFIRSLLLESLRRPPDNWDPEVVLGDGQRLRVSLLLLELTFPWLTGHVPPPRLLLLPDMNAEEFNRTLGLFLGESSASSAMEEANIDNSRYRYPVLITLCSVWDPDPEPQDSHVFGHSLARGTDPDPAPDPSMFS